MKVFELRSTAWSGFIEFTFADNGLLEKYDLGNAHLSDSQQVYLLKHMPREEAEITNLKTPHTTITEVPSVVSFDDFWKKYDDKTLSSRKKTLVKWSKMSTGDQYRAYKHINKYFSSLPSGTRKKYAETYLNAELWNN